VSYQRILVAVRDPDTERASTLRKAAALARAAGASIELFHAISDPFGLDLLQRADRGARPNEAMARIGERLRVRLERLARLKLFAGVDVRARVAWDYPPHEAIVRRALAVRADLVVAESRTRRWGSRFLLANTDWELIRACPCPLLLVKSAAAYERPAVVAAVDPLHERDKPAALDARLLAAGKDAARLLRGTLHAFHAYLPPVAVLPIALGTSELVTLAPEAEQRYEQHVRRAFDRLMKRAGVARARRHLCVGDVSARLEDTVRRTRAAIVVMGAISRSGLKRLFVGSTAEDLLDRLRCDVLIVKPRGFATPVARRSPY
jgi:universal stress protein E